MHRPRSRQSVVPIASPIGLRSRPRLSEDAFRRMPPVHTAACGRAAPVRASRPARSSPSSWPSLAVLPGRRDPRLRPASGATARGVLLRARGRRRRVHAGLGGRGHPARHLGRPRARPARADRGAARVRGRLRLHVEGGQGPGDLRAGRARQHDRRQPAPDRRRVVDGRARRRVPRARRAPRARARGRSRRTSTSAPPTSASSGRTRSRSRSSCSRRSTGSRCR